MDVRAVIGALKALYEAAGGDPSEWESSAETIGGAFWLTYTAVCEQASDLDWWIRFQDPEFDLNRRKE